MSDHIVEPKFETVSSELPTAEFPLAFASSWMHEQLGKNPEKITGYSEYANCGILLADLIERCIVFGSDKYDAVSDRLEQMSRNRSDWARFEIIVIRA